MHVQVSYIFLSTCIVIKSMLWEPINSIPLNINLVTLLKKTKCDIIQRHMVQVASHFKYFASKWNMCCTKHAETQLVGMSDVFLKKWHMRQRGPHNTFYFKTSYLKTLQHAYIHRYPIKTHIFPILELPSIIFYIMSDRLPCS